MALGYIPEAGFHYGGIDDVGCHHLTVFILDGLHNDEFATVIVMDYQRVGPGHLKQFHLLDPGFLDHADGRLHLLCLDSLNLAWSCAALGTKQRNQNGKENGTHHHRKRSEGTYCKQSPVVLAHILPIIGALAIVFIPDLYFLE